jgi:hypothetical protein
MTEVDTNIEVSTGDEVDIDVSQPQYVEVIVQLGDRTTRLSFRRDFGQPDDNPLELLDALVDAVKSYLETF